MVYIMNIIYSLYHKYIFSFLVLEKQEVEELQEEADMPIEKLMERYGAANKTMHALREKGDNFQSPALRAKAEPVDKIEADHIKQNMSNKILNGDHEDSDEKCVSNGHGDKKDANKDSSVTKENNEAKLKAEPASGDSKSKSGASVDGSAKDSLPDSTQTEDKPEAANTKESASKSDSSDVAASSASSKTVDSTEADQSSTTKSSAEQSEAAVSSSSETPKQAGGSSGSGGSSSDQAGGSSGGSSSAADSASKV